MIARARTAAGAAFLSLVLAGCGRSVITAGRLEPAIAATFANLVHAQLARMGLHAIPASDLKVVASCYRVGGGSSGPGVRCSDWKIVALALVHHASALSRTERSTSASGLASDCSRQKSHDGQSTVAT